MFFQLFGVNWVMPHKVSDCLGSWRGQLGNRLALHVWRLIPLCMMWCLWQERNTHSLDDHESGVIELKKLLLTTLFSWRVIRSHSPETTFNGFLYLMIS